MERTHKAILRQTNPSFKRCVKHTEPKLMPRRMKSTQRYVGICVYWSIAQNKIIGIYYMTSVVFQYSWYWLKHVWSSNERCCAVAEWSDTTVDRTAAWLHLGCWDSEKCHHSVGCHTDSWRKVQGRVPRNDAGGTNWLRWRRRWVTLHCYIFLFFFGLHFFSVMTWWNGSRCPAIHVYVCLSMLFLSSCNEMWYVGRCPLSYICCLKM